MAVTYTSNLKLGLPTSGTESGTWGDVVNNQITTLVDQSISGTVSLTSMTNADYTLTNGNGNAANEARYMALLVPSSLTLTAARNIIVPSTSKTYIVKNATTGGFSVTVKTSAGTGIAVPNGNEMLLYCDGTNVVVAFDTINVNSVNSGQLAGLRNRIINGSMRIAQRGTATLTSVDTYGGCDRTFGGPTGFTTSSGTILQGGGLGGGYTSSGYLQCVFLASTTGTGTVRFGQKIEALNTSDLNGKTITISAKFTQDSGSALNVAAAVYRPTTTADDFSTQTLLSTSSAVSVPSSGAAATTLTHTFTLGAADASKGLAVYFSYTGIGAVTNKSFYIGDIQLEIGSVATTFEQRPIGMELELCQRYYETGFAEQLNNTGASATVGFTTFYKVTKRAVPSTISLTVGAVVNSVSAAFSSYQEAIASGTYYQFNWTSTAEL